jgi:hypothetical protein
MDLLVLSVEAVNRVQPHMTAHGSAAWTLLLHLPIPVARDDGTLFFVETKGRALLALGAGGVRERISALRKSRTVFASRTGFDLDHGRLGAAAGRKPHRDPRQD